MTDRLFLMHGMGYQPEGWHVETKQMLQDFYKEYVRGGATRDLDEVLKIVPITYDQIFRNLLQRWDDAADQAKVANKFGVDLVQGLLGWANGVAEVEDNFFWTHVADVILYRYSKFVREGVRVYAANQINQELQSMTRSETWSIIGHSLGTMVAHDALHGWYTERENPRNRCTLVMMVSNVSRILQTQPKVLSDGTTVRPGGACDYYYTVYHPIDPFTQIRPFKPVVWPSRDAHLSREYRLINVDHIQQPNIHALNHYLGHPDVIFALFEGMNFQITLAKQEEYRRKFNPVGTLDDANLVKIRQGSEDIGIGLPQEASALVEIWKRFQAFLRTF